MTEALNLKPPSPLTADHQSTDFAMLVHALNDPAKQFYLSRGFVESPLQATTLMMTIETIRLILAEPD